MSDYESTLESLMSVKNLDNFTSEEALSHIGQLTDLAFDLKQVAGLQHSIKLSKELQERDLTDGQLALSHYFVANAHSDIRRLSTASTDKSWEWEQEDIEKEIFHLRKALQAGQSLPDERICQILTNLGNLMNEIGRFVEAVEYWDTALGRVPSFPMARGNRGFGLTHYARTLYDRGHAIVFLKYAHADLTKVLSFTLYQGAERGFSESKKWIESVIPKEDLEKDFDMNSFSLGRSKAEKGYRQWCLNNRLFLNPLNDLGPYPIGGRDIFTTPSIVVDLGEGPYYPGYFNQMKQEFVSARYLYYEGIKAESAEKMKAAFRMAYSLFDKIAYFLNHYLRLSIPEKKVSFRTIWYKSQNKKIGLKKDFQNLQNWPLRGLFWLSKDLYEDKQGFKESIEPDAQELNEIRNHLEHKYLKLHDDMWFGPSEKDHEVFKSMADTLAFSMYRRDFERKALRLLKMSRAALIYLSLAIHWEEQRRKKERGPDAIVPGMPMDVWEDKWKV
jgi:hypothetical protein